MLQEIKDYIRRLLPQDVNNTLYVITVIFNPNDFKSRYTLYRDFEAYMRYSKARLITVEVAFGDRPFKVTSSLNPWHLQLRTNDELWHKEAAINAGFQHLISIVPNAKYIGWFDADIKFTNPSWVQDTIKALHRYAIVQPFSEAQYLNSKHESLWSTASALKNYQNKLGYSKTPPPNPGYLCGGHPGLAWAARASTFKALGGLMDFCVAGSGDTHMLNALVGDATMFYRIGFESKVGWKLMPEFRDKLVEWGQKAHEHVKFNIGYVNGICYHYWHGPASKRGYEKRWDIINFHRFNPVNDLVMQSNGLYSWAGNKPNLEYDLRRSLSERNEDNLE